MGDEYDRRVTEVFRRVLRVNAQRLPDDTRRGSLDEWDSLGHVMLVAALAEEFGIAVPPDRALQMHTLGDVKRIVREIAG
jgi:acyl carrier protein